MTDKFVFVEYKSNLNDVIKQPLQQTQRIKFTCFDVSVNYLVFGASSGGIYVFRRYPCSFIKLIPNKEGAVTQILVTPDEKTLIFATSKGLVIVLQNCFEETNLTYQQFTEHEGSIVTVLKWYNNEIYCGDSNGNVSVVSLTTLLTKAIFQTPSASLMKLDSQIIQIDAYARYLLISTQTRTYLCDTDKETYRQVGSKLRDGAYGACFIPGKNQQQKPPPSKSFFQVSEPPSEDVLSDVKIFCSRPGARLWLADFEASVTCTYQFKNALIQRPTNIIHIDSATDGRLSITDFSIVPYSIPQVFNFGKTYCLPNQFIFTFSSDTLYVFQPDTVCLLFWSNYYDHIVDVRFVSNYLYICTEDFTVHVVSVTTLEDLVLKTLFFKQYLLCADLCIHFSDHVRSLIKTSNRIHLISILKDKLLESDSESLLEQISPVLNELQEFSASRKASQRLNNGIFVVDNAYFAKQSEESVSEEQSFSEPFQVLKDIRTVVAEKLSEGGKNLKEKLQIFEATVKNLTTEQKTVVETTELINEKTKQSCETNELVNGKTKDCGEMEEQLDVEVVEPVADVNYIVNMLYRQYELTKINKNVEIERLKKILDSKDAASVLDLLDKFKENMDNEKRENEQVQLWCYSQYLKYLSRQNLANVFENYDCELRAFLCAKDAFVLINASPECGCKCGYPLPSAKSKTPHFQNVGQEICKKLSDSVQDLDNISKQVPYMWKYILKDARKHENISTLVPLIIQYCDEELFKYFLEKFTYDIWEDAVKLLIKLKSRQCVNCEVCFETEGMLPWTVFGMLMVQSIGGISTVKLLKRHAGFIPSGELDAEFYQMCIFSTTMDNLQDGFRNEAVSFVKEMTSEEKMAQQFSTVMEKYLHKQYLRKLCYDVVNHQVAENGSFCAYCELPLKIEVLEETQKMPCGHFYHKICLNYNRNVCCACKIHK